MAHIRSHRWGSNARSVRPPCRPSPTDRFVAGPQHRIGFNWRRTTMAASPKSVGEGQRLTALFSDGDAAERAYQVCIDRGHTVGDINVVVSEGTRSKLLETDEAIKSELASRKAEGG